MRLIDPDALRNAERVYLAASLTEARQVEQLLSGSGVDYVVQVEALGRTTLFGSLRHGAGFYVTSGQAAHCRSLLAGAGMARVVAEEPEARADKL